MHAIEPREPVLELFNERAQLGRRISIFEQRRFERASRLEIQLREQPIECVQIVWLQLENLVLGHEDGQTPRSPNDCALACEADQLPAKALLECAMTQKFIEQIVGDLLVMNSGCEPRRNQRSSLAKTQRRKVLKAGLLLTVFTALTILTVFSLVFLLLPFFLFLLRAGKGAEGDYQRGIQSFGAITFQNDGNGIDRVGLVAFAFVFLAL